MELNPQNHVYVYNLGFLYYQLDKYKEARQILEMALKLAPKDPDINFLLGKTCVQLKDKVAATERYQALQKLDAKQGAELEKLINR